MINYKNRKFELNKQNNMKKSNNKQCFIIFSKVSTFFPELRFGLFAVTNSKQKGW